MMTKESNVILGKGIKYDYDKTGNIIKLIDPENEETKYNYDELNSLTVVSNNGKFISMFEYDKMSRRKRQTNANGSYSEYEYDNADNLLSLVHYKDDNFKGKIKEIIRSKK